LYVSRRKLRQEISKYEFKIEPWIKRGSDAHKFVLAYADYCSVLDPVNTYEAERMQGVEPIFWEEYNWYKN